MVRGVARRHIDLVKEEGLRRLHALVRDHPDFEVVRDPTPQAYSFRCVPHAFSERQDEPGIQAFLDRLNQGIVDALAPSGKAPITVTRIHGRVALHVSIGSRDSLAADVDRAFEAIAREGRRLATDGLAAARSAAAQEEAC
jgi:glutamate/tyrosine decarboxylase-like PLP-dependent enzyme